MASLPVRYYGAKPDSYDRRDVKKRFEPKEIPGHGSKDLRKYVPFVYNQGQLGSCTANAVCAAYAIDLKKEGKQVFKPSRLFVYYNTRAREGTVCEDSGALSLRDVVKATQKLGMCREERPKPCWPYDGYKTRFKQKPPKECYDAAKGNTVSVYEKLEDPTDINQIRACLNQEYPLVFGFRVYRNFQATAGDRGTLAKPTDDDKKAYDMHAVVAVGYNDEKRCITVLNSWGEHWGTNGYFYMPYDFITSEEYCFDFWKIEFADEKSSSPRPAQGTVKTPSVFSPKVKIAWADDETTSSRQNPSSIGGTSKSPQRNREAHCCAIV